MLDPPMLMHEKLSYWLSAIKDCHSMKIGPFVFAVVLVFSTGTASYAQNTPPIVAKAPLDMDLSKTIGFIEGQRLTLKNITQRFPDLSSSALAASLEFESAFGTAEEQMKSHFQSILKDRYPKFILDLQSQLAVSLDFKKMTIENAQKFISEVGSRANGNIPSPFLETLLTYEYKDNPSEEFSRRYIRKYNTKGHQKAEELDITVSYPLSWEPTEGERPNIVQNFRSENGRGFELFSLMVKNIPLPERYVISDQELDEFFTNKSLQKMVPAGGKFIYAKPVILDNNKAGVVVFDQTAQRLGTTMTTRIQTYTTIVKQKMISLNFSVIARDENNDTFEKRSQKFEPLFMMIANSFIIQNQYSKP